MRNHSQEVRHGIRFDNVHFRYRQEWVLQGITLEIRTGEVVALVGPSGGGKSTIADLIPRFYDVQKGRIAIDGIDIRDVTLASLRSQLAIVSQSTFLFNDTVRNNIAYGMADMPMEDIIAAAQAAYAHDFIMDFHTGMTRLLANSGPRCQADSVNVWPLLAHCSRMHRF